VAICPPFPKEYVPIIGMYVPNKQSGRQHRNHSEHTSPDTGEQGKPKSLLGPCSQRNGERDPLGGNHASVEPDRSQPSTGWPIPKEPALKKVGRRFMSQPSRRPTRRYAPTATATSNPHTSRRFTRRSRFLGGSAVFEASPAARPLMETGQSLGDQATKDRLRDHLASQLLDLGVVSPATYGKAGQTAWELLLGGLLRTVG